MRCSELTPDMADQLTRPDAKREFALVAAEPLPPGEALVGAVARAAIDRPRPRGRIRHPGQPLHRRHGPGPSPDAPPGAWAKGRKLDRLYGDVLEHNQPMLALAKSLGFRASRRTQPGLVRVVLDLNRRAARTSDVGAEALGR